MHVVVTYIYIYIYQNNVVNNNCGTLENVFHDSEKRNLIKVVVISMNMGCINVIRDLLV